MKYALIIGLSLIASASLLSQNGEKEAREVVEAFFEGLNTQDTALIKSSLYEEVEMATVVKGTRPVKVESLQQFLSGVHRSRGMDLEERITSFKILLDEGMAVVWAPYRFYVNQQLSHCGVNAFTLILTENGWKIHYIIDTRRKENCHPEK